MTDEQKPKDADKGEGDDKGKGGELPLLADIDEGELAKMVKEDLASLCRANGLADDGTKGELVARLAAKRLGGDKRQIHGKTLCPACDRVARCVTTRDRVARYRCENPACPGLRTCPGCGRVASPRTVTSGGQNYYCCKNPACSRRYFPPQKTFFAAR